MTISDAIKLDSLEKEIKTARLQLREGLIDQDTCDEVVSRAKEDRKKLEWEILNRGK